MRTALLAVLAAALPALAAARDVPRYDSLKDPAEIAEAYKKAKLVADKATRALESDPALYSWLLAADHRADKAAMFAAVEKSSAAASPAVMTVVANPDFFWIDSYEGGLSCGVALPHWISVAERPGPSAESWKLRQAYLDGLAGVDMPWCEGLCDGPSFESLTSALTEAQGVYSRSAYRGGVSSWANLAAERFRRKLVTRETKLKFSKDDAERQAFPEQAEKVRGWIEVLQAFAKDAAVKQ